MKRGTTYFFSSRMSAISAMWMAVAPPPQTKTESRGLMPSRTVISSMAATMLWFEVV